MFHKLTSLATLPDYILLAGFNDGEYRQFDLKPFINKYPAFKTLTEIPALYEQAKIEVVTELTETSRGEGGFGSTGK